MHATPCNDSDRVANPQVQVLFEMIMDLSRWLYFHAHSIINGRVFQGTGRLNSE